MFIARRLRIASTILHLKPYLPKRMRVADSEVLKVRKRDGYELRKMRLSMEDGSYPIVLTHAYTPEGHYIGDPKFARRLIKERGIVPELSSPENQVCSIGFCEKEQAWYGWSHRAICGYTVGYVVTPDDSCASSGYISEYLHDHPEKDRRVPVGFVVKTLKDAKRCAIAFADSVS